jgi:branched-chain amino acid transport system ATP-binding protein
LLTLNEVVSYIAQLQVIQGVSLQVAEGEFVTLLGSNGAGKTTLLRTIAGVIRPARGIIRFREKEIQGLPPHRIVELGVSLCPEGRQLFPQLSVEKNLVLGAYTRRKDKNLIKESLREAYELFPILAERSRQPAGTLSGGQQQMLAIARALMSKPKLLLLDEPSMGLAPMIVRKIMMEVLREIHKRGTTLLLSEQNANMALMISERAYVMESGKIALEGPSQELLRDEKVKRAYIGA